MKIHLVPHQHFDLIWRRPVLWYRERRAQLFRQILALLTANEDFTYSFSQVLALKEFLEDSPGEWDTVERLIRAGRLEWIGGSLSIPDLNMISPDALIRNIQAGRRYLHEEFGCEVIVGAFEDAFGVSAQLPQILSLCGYQYYKAGRMPRGMGAEPSGCFRWEAQDGTEIRCIANSPDGMSWGWGHPDNPDEPPASHAERRKRLETELRNAVRGALHSGLSDALVTCRGEEHDVFSEFIPLVRELRSELAESGIELEFSTHERCCRSIRNWEETPLYRCTEDFSRLFTGCYTARIESKEHPRALESELLACAFAGEKIPASAVESLTLLQFHDAICGCHISENADFLAKRWEEAHDSLRSLQRLLPWKALWRPFGNADQWRSPAGSMTFGEWEILLDSGKRLSGLRFAGNAVPLPQIVAREENGTLWTEEYHGKMHAFSPDEQTAEFCLRDGELQIRSTFCDRNFRNYWPGFSRLAYTKILKFHPDWPWMEMILDYDFLGSSTELSVRLPAENCAIRSGTAEIPFGQAGRGEYPRELTRSELFPALHFVAFGNYLWLNAGTPGHAFREGALENIFLRSPVKRWAPWFPVTPEESMWDNGRRSCRFALCADALRHTRGEWHRIGMEFQLAAYGISCRTDVPQGWENLPADLVPCALDEEGFLWIFNAADQMLDWPDRNLRLRPHEIRKVEFR